ncbi:MAG: hypothetical protein M3024_10825 [Candidatus Dormibacteraeota bacterium]|nr:hypothetical protein [Candidatus Dormibacteraeota bacterium]
MCFHLSSWPLSRVPGQRGHTHLLAALAGLAAVAAAACSQPGSSASALLPRPHLAPPDESVTAPPGQPLPYFGPAHLRLAVASPGLPAHLPVYAFTVPAADHLAATARAHGGSLVLPSPPNYREPQIFITSGSLSDSGHAPAADAAAVAAATFLADRSLTPAWTYRRSEVSYGAFGVVSMLRQFPVDGYGPAGQLDAHGAEAGASVIVGPDGAVRQATVPFPLPLRRQDHKAASPAAITQAVTRLQGAPATGPEPDVALTAVTLSYLAVSAGGTGYFEPVLLFTGDFQRDGTGFRMRVLVPALDAGQMAAQ